MGTALEDLMGHLKILPPGFRFNPTDEELICDYLRIKCSKSSKNPFMDLMITDIDLYRYDAFDLPGLSCFQGTERGNDNQWFFFTRGDSKKYTKGSRVSRTTQSGYWRTTGQDRDVISKGVTVGMKKTLVFYTGRGNQSKWTKWIMYEYSLAHNNAGNAKLCSSGKESRKKDPFVLCRVCLRHESKEKTKEKIKKKTKEKTKKKTKEKIKKKTKEQHGDSCQGEKSTYEGSAIATEKGQHENVATYTAKKVGIKDRDLPFGPFIASSAENNNPTDDCLQKVLLECLHDPAEEQTGHGLPQVLVGDARPDSFDYAWAKDAAIQNDEPSICNVPIDVPMDEDLDEILPGDFLELKDLEHFWS